MVRKIYRNDAFITLEKKRSEVYVMSGIDVDQTDKPHIAKVRAVFFELSNQCNYTHIHPMCPTSCQKKKRTLSSEIYYKVISELADVGFSGVISFHRYNEPLIDPRLGTFIRYASEKLPCAHLRVLTNGCFLTQEIADALIDEGLSWLECSAYSVFEYERLVDLHVPIPYYVFVSILDERLELYASEVLHLKKACYAPLNDITITCDGQLGLCCLDWKDSCNFGSLKTSKLTDLLDGITYQTVFSNLAAGSRNLDICSRCDWAR